MTDETALPPGFSEQDIIFECPRCGKSLGIDERGAGLIVRCPDCGLRMQVPVPETENEPHVRADKAVESFAPADLARPGASDAAVERVSYSDDDVHDRRRRLEKMRLDYLARFEKIREEVALIQAGLDRMVGILQDVAGEAPSAGEEP